MEDLIYIVFFIIIVIISMSMISSWEAKENIANYPISDAILINNFISYSRFGSPCYYLVYKFKDDSIKEFKVSAEIYYKSIKIDIIEIEEGS